MEKKLLIINEYAGSPYHGMEFRHYCIGKELVKKGYDVTIISSSYSHLFKNLPTKKYEIIDGVNYLWLKTLNYGQSHSKKRVLKWFIFTIKCFFLTFKFKKPDVIIVSNMAPFSILPAWLTAKIFKAKLIFEVKDIWPLSIIELGDYSPKHPFIRLMSFFEKFALKKSDVIVSNLPNYGEYLKDININRDFIWISNGIDLDEINQVEPLDDSIKNLIPKNKFIVGYAGTIGVANALDSFLEASKYINNKDIVFLIVGDGQEKDRLKKLYQSENIIFLDSVPKKQIQSLLKYFDVCFLGWKNKNIYKYGISANKIFDYMYSGKPILHSYNGNMDIVSIANCGLKVDAENPKAIAEGILKFYFISKEEREKMGQNGRVYVLKNLTYDKLASRYEEIL